MAFHTRQQHFSGQIVTTNSRHFVINQAPAARLKNPVQMGSANPFATTEENPWVGMNHMLLGSNNMVIHPQPNAPIAAHSNMLVNGQRKRSGLVSTESQVNNQSVYFPIPDYAPQNIKDEMLVLCQKSKRLKLQFAEKQKQAVQHLVESVRTPVLNILKEKDAEISNLGNLNKALQEYVKNLFDANQKWKEYASAWEIKTMSLRNNLEIALDMVSRLQGIVPPINGAVMTPHEEQDVKSYRGSNVSEKNKPGDAQVVGVEDVGETAGEKGQTEAADTGEGSGEKKMWGAAERWR